MATLDVVVPPGVGAGETIEITDEGGRQHHATVPEGLREGDTFRVELEAECGTLMDAFENWFEREKIDDQIEEFIIRNAQHLDVTNAELEGGTDGEQSHNWWPIYQVYQETFEALLQEFLDSAGCSAEEFLAAAKDASGIAEMYTKWFLSLSSYEMFVECMMDEEKRQRGMVDGSDGRREGSL